MAELCNCCGKLHEENCPAPVREPPSGLVGADGRLTPAGAAVEDAANYLAMRGYLDPNGDEFPDWVLAELADLYQAGTCESCPGTLTGSTLADHFLSRKQEEYERSVPTWECNCGRKFKVLPEPRGEAYFEARADGLMGDLIGYVRLDSQRQKAKHSDACPDCKHKFADTIAEQLDPQQALF
ncbi:hypothetical protein GCM10009733_008130 [Nonomuraea maheshkhaliensis]|uniref:HNH endonuclease n=1 Tax=Nonomuraea maheshkhaliensis TaxID=419590 RepID=A0ABN2EQA5_9ACTN